MNRLRRHSPRPFSGLWPLSLFRSGLRRRRWWIRRSAIPVAESPRGYTCEAPWCAARIRIPSESRSLAHIKAVLPALHRALTSAFVLKNHPNSPFPLPSPRRSLTISILPEPAAIIRTVVPSCLDALTLEPLSIRSRAMSRCPARHAFIRGVAPICLSGCRADRRVTQGS
jgi:hypothetical protein